MNHEHLSLVCNHKHMLKCGAPPHSFGVLYHLFPMEFNGLNKQIEF